MGYLCELTFQLQHNEKKKSECSHRLEQYRLLDQLTLSQI